MTSRERVAAAATLLFVPGDRPERFAKAIASGADLVVLDLEDAVAPTAKEDARRHVAKFASGRSDVVVRVNASDTPWHLDDLRMVREAHVGLMLPKAVPVDMPQVLDEVGTIPLIALVETARGVIATADLAAAPGVDRLALGTYDLATELGVSPDDRDAMMSARGTLVMASAAAGIAAPIDGVTGAVRDQGKLVDDVGHARRLGFSGKLCIHPAQVAPAADAFLPSEEEIDWAREVVAAAEAASAAGSGVVLVGGAMVDAPVVNRAQRLLAASRCDIQDGQ